MLSYTNLLKFERQRDVKGKVSSQLIQRPNNYAEWKTWYPERRATISQNFPMKIEHDGKK